MARDKIVFTHNFKVNYVPKLYSRLLSDCASPEYLEVIFFNIETRAR